MAGYWIILIEEKHSEKNITIRRKVYRDEIGKLLNGLAIGEHEIKELQEGLKQKYYGKQLNQETNNIEIYYWIEKNSREDFYLMERFYELFETIYTAKITYYENREGVEIECSRIEYSDNKGEIYLIDLNTAEEIRGRIDHTKQILKEVHVSEHEDTEEALEIQQQILELVIGYQNHQKHQTVCDQIFDPTEYFAITENTGKISLEDEEIYRENQGRTEAI